MNTRRTASPADPAHRSRTAPHRRLTRVPSSAGVSATPIDTETLDRLPGVPLRRAVTRSFAGFATVAAGIGLLGLVRPAVRDAMLVAAVAALANLYRRAERRSGPAIAAAAAATVGGVVAVAGGALLVASSLPDVVLRLLCAACGAVLAGVAYSIVSRSG